MNAVGAAGQETYYAMVERLLGEGTACLYRENRCSLAFGGDRLALLELSVEDSAYGQSYAQCASRTA
jgi:hypothetical protein